MSVTPTAGDTRDTPWLPTLPPALSDRLGECHTLPSLPDAVVRVLMVARSPEASLVDYARAIEQDPALTLRLLSLANSAFYARHQTEPHTCRDAVSRIGLDATLAAVMSFGLARCGDRSPQLQQLWQRAIIAALGARFLAQQLCPSQAGTLFTVALLQDIGILALRSLDPDQAADLYVREPREHPQLIAEERRTFGCDHAQVGGWLASRWGMPQHLARGISESHGELSVQNLQGLCLRLSGPLADAWLSPTPAKAMVRLLQRLESLPLEPGVSLPRMLEEIQQQLPSMAELLEVTSPPRHDNETLFKEAQQHLFRQTLALSARLDAHQAELETLRQRQDELEARSRRDALTGLANRAWLEEQLEARFQLCKEQQRTLSLAFIDLDHFKQLNDEYGHPLGDRVLERFASILQSTVREGDLAGRFGGEEFLVVLPDEQAQGARIMADRLQQRLAETPLARVDGQEVFVTVSIGIACLEDDRFSEARELIDAADQCMYRIKRSGRSGIAIHGHTERPD